MLLDSLKTHLGTNFLISEILGSIYLCLYISVTLPPPGESVLHSSVGLVDPGENHPEQILTAVKSTRKVRLNESLKPTISC